MKEYNWKTYSVSIKIPINVNKSINWWWNKKIDQDIECI